MLKKLTVRGFKSLADTSVTLPRMSVLFGPNAAGKSNLLDSILALSRIGTLRTLRDALDGRMIRGYPIESFTLPADGMTGLLAAPSAKFLIEADLTTSSEIRKHGPSYRYRIEVEVTTASGTLSNRGEYLCALSVKGDEKGKPAIDVDGNHLNIRRQSGGGRPRIERLPQNYAILSDRRLGNPGFKYIERTRAELWDWRTYYLDPRMAMRFAQPPADVADIGVFGERIAPFLYKLKAGHEKRFLAVLRTLRSIIPNIETFDVELDRRRGILDLVFRQGDTNYSSRVVSEGTLRVLGLCAIAVNPWGGSLLAFEEPENGVHPRRLELIAQLLTSLALEQGRQVIVTTHSPLFCDVVLKQARERKSSDIALFNVLRVGQETRVKRFDAHGPFFDDPQIAETLASRGEDGVFESLLLRGLLDE